MHMYWIYYICILFLVLDIMYLIPEDGQYDWNMYHVLMGLIKLVVVHGICLSVFNMYSNLQLNKNEVIFWS